MTQVEFKALGYEPMDETHREFVALANRALAAGRDELPELFHQLLEHTRTHFAAEERQMQQSAFSALAEHRAEHQRVLGEMTMFLERAQRGRTTMAKEYLQQRLPGWFSVHLVTMDSALAAHLAHKS